jgi:hypothetical protein
VERGGVKRRERRRCAEKRGCQTPQSDGEIHDRRVKNSSLRHEVHVITHIIVTLKHKQTLTKHTFNIQKVTFKKMNCSPHYSP